MASLAEPVALYDVRDCESFVQATLNASRRVYGPDEREELVCEGLRIMCELAARYEPQREGYDGQGRFSGFAAKYLRLKLEDAYHRMHPEHRLVAQPDGKRRYHYGEKAVSLEAMTADDPDRHPVLTEADEAVVGHTVSVEEVAERLGLTRQQFDYAVAELRAVARKLGSWGDVASTATAASLLRDRCEERYETGLRVAGALAEGLTSDKDIADHLRISSAQVREARADLEPIARRLRTLNQR